MTAGRVREFDVNSITPIRSLESSRRVTADAGRPSLILFALLFSAMAETLAAQTSAGIHLTFLDAYVPKGWDPKALGALSADPCHVCRAEHYFTRGRVEHLTENLLAHAHNVDITSINPGFDSHNFPRHWYCATILGRYDTRKKRLAGAKVVHEAGGTQYGYLRAREAGPDCWELSVALPAGENPAVPMRAKPTVVWQPQAQLGDGRRV
jgi:hypothetical protein